MYTCTLPDPHLFNSVIIVCDSLYLPCTCTLLLTLLCTFFRKDKRVEEHIEKKLKAAGNELQLLKKQERLVTNKMKRKSEETKLSIF